MGLALACGSVRGDGAIWLLPRQRQNQTRTMQCIDESKDGRAHLREGRGQGRTWRSEVRLLVKASAAARLQSDLVAGRSGG